MGGRCQVWWEEEGWLSRGEAQVRGGEGRQRAGASDAEEECGVERRRGVTGRGSSYSSSLCRYAGCLAFMLGCLVSGAASQGNTYSNPVAYDAPTDFTFNFKSTKLVTLGSTPLDGSVFPVQCKTRWWQMLMGYYAVGAVQRCAAGGTAPSCVVTHAQCKAMCVADATCKGYYIPGLNNFGSTCRDQTQTDTSGTCKCYLYGPTAVLQDVTDFGSVDNAPKLNDVEKWTTWVKKSVSCPDTQKYPVTVINTRETSVFVAAALNATGPISFSYSPTMAGHIDKQMIQIIPFDTVSEAGAIYRVFSMHIPEFVPAPGLGLCITLASSLPSRCISFAPQVAPDAMEVVGVRTDGEASDGLLKSSGPVTVVVSETLYISVRAHDPNPEDAVVISVKSAVSPYFPARQITVSESYWSNLMWMGPTTCPSMSNDGMCLDGWWERSAAYVPLKDDSWLHNITFTAEDNGDRFVPPAGYLLYNGTKGWSTQNISLGIQVVGNVPAFIDEAQRKGGLSGASPLGTPPAESDLPSAYVNCPMRPVGVYAHFATSLLNMTFSSGARSGGAPAVLPAGMTLGGFGVWEYRIPTAAGIEINKNAAYAAINWTPKRGEEGKRYRVCVTATVYNSTAMRERCWGINVALCQYCVPGSATLRSVALEFQTSWLQLWGVNSQPITERDGSVDSRRWISPTDPDTFVSGDSRLIVVGPVYRVKVSDSLASISTRFHTQVDRILAVNPTIRDPMNIKPGQDICVIPSICPTDSME